MPKVSVIIPSHNCARYLPDAIRSVLAQTYRDREIIVVDDGSTDDTKDSLQPYLSDIVYIYQKNSGGPSGPRNVGIDAARGRYVSFLDADDKMFPDKLQHAVHFLEEVPSLGLVFTNFVKQGEGGEQHPSPFLARCRRFNLLEKRGAGERRFVIRGEVAFDTLLLENFIGTSSVVCPKAVFSAVGQFDASLASVEDRDMWLRIARSYDVGYYDAVDHIYLDRASSISKQALTASVCGLKVLERYMGEAHSEGVRREAAHALALRSCETAYHYANSGDLSAARKAYLKGFRRGSFWRSGRGLFRTTWLGRGLVAARSAVFNSLRKATSSR